MYLTNADDAGQPTLWVQHARCSSQRCQGWQRVNTQETESNRLKKNIFSVAGTSDNRLYVTNGLFIRLNVLRKECLNGTVEGNREKVCVWEALQKRGYQILRAGFVRFMSLSQSYLLLFLVDLSLPTWWRSWCGEQREHVWHPC